MCSSQRSQAFELATTTERLQVGGGYTVPIKKERKLFPRLDDHGSKAKDIGLIFISLSLRLKSITKQAHEGVMLSSLYPIWETVSFSSQRKN